MAKQGASAESLFCHERERAFSASLLSTETFNLESSFSQKKISDPTFPLLSAKAIEMKEKGGN